MYPISLPLSFVDYRLLQATPPLDGLELQFKLNSTSSNNPFLYILDCPTQTYLTDLHVRACVVFFETNLNFYRNLERASHYVATWAKCRKHSVLFIGNVTTMYYDAHTIFYKVFTCYLLTGGAAVSQTFRQDSIRNCVYSTNKPMFIRSVRRDSVTGIISDLIAFSRIEQRLLDTCAYINPRVLKFRPFLYNFKSIQNLYKLLLYPRIDLQYLTAAAHPQLTCKKSNKVYSFIAGSYVYLTYFTLLRGLCTTALTHFISWQTYSFLKQLTTYPTTSNKHFVKLMYKSFFCSLVGFNMIRFRVGLERFNQILPSVRFLNKKRIRNKIYAVNLNNPKQIKNDWVAGLLFKYGVADTLLVCFYITQSIPSNAEANIRKINKLIFNYSPHKMEVDYRRIFKL